MAQSGEKAESKGRLTSSGLHPRRGVPLPERLVKRKRQAASARILQDFDLPPEWQAGVSKVEWCSNAEYDGGRGLKTIFPMGEDPKRRCTILCSGDTTKLTISLEVSAKYQDPSPHILHQFDLPSDDDRIGIRLYDVDVSMEFREHPRNPKQRKSQRRAEMTSGECWVVHLETSLKEQVMVKAKRMLRRLESVTGSMPADWFSHRNYLLKDPSGKPGTSSAEFRDGVFTQTFVGGYSWRFTGNLASKEFQEALMGKFPDDNAQEVTPTRVQPFRTSKGKKAAKKIPGKLRRLERVQQRSLAPEKSSQETSEIPDTQREEAGQPKMASPAGLSPEFEPGPSESDDSGVSFTIEGLLGKRIRDGEVEYEVEWTGDSPSTWEPAANVSAVSIAEFEESLKRKSSKSRRKASQKKKEQTKTSTANAAKTRSATKAAEELAKQRSAP